MTERGQVDSTNLTRWNGRACCQWREEKKNQIGDKFIALNGQVLIFTNQTLSSVSALGRGCRQGCVLSPLEMEREDCLPYSIGTVILYPVVGD